MIAINNEELLIFNNFRKMYPGEKRGNMTEIQDFAKKHKDWKFILPTLSKFLENQIVIREKKRLKGEWLPQWKNIKTYLYQRCWEVDNDEEVVESQNIIDLFDSKKSPQQIHQEKIKNMRIEDELEFKAYGKHKYTQQELTQPYFTHENTTTDKRDELSI